MRVWHCSLLVMMLAFRAEADAFTTPFAGEVTNARGPLAVRSGPPTATASTYMLGKFLCAAFPRTIFYATEARQIANGETWYAVQIKTPTGAHPSSCPAGATGWMVGELKNHTSVVALQSAGTAPPLGSAVPTEPKPPPANLLPESSGHTILFYCPFIILGTLITIILVTWERHGSVAAEPLKHGLVYLKAVTLCVFNVAALAIIAPAYVTVNAKAADAQMIQELSRTWYGNLALGIVLTVLLLRAVSFAKQE